MSGFFVLNADDLGISESRNNAIFSAYKNGALRSASLIVNFDSFSHAIEIINRCENLGVGIHLNIMEGAALLKQGELTNGNGVFNNSFIKILRRSRDKKFLSAVENEFRAQIEKGAKFARLDHLDSHIHVHAIPNIFLIAAKLAGEYKIPFIRTQRETPYITPGKVFTIKYPINLIKVALLNYFTKINAPRVKPPLKTNDLIIGVGYTGMMSAAAALRGIKNIRGGITEIIIHPEPENEEYKLALDDDLKNLNIASYSDLIKTADETR